METIKLNENTLNTIISECITEVFNEINEGKTFSKKNPDDFKKMKSIKGYNRKESKPAPKDDDNLDESKTTIKLTEAELTKLVSESTLRILKESDMDEGWFGDKWNQAKTAVNTFTQHNNNGMGLKDRFNAAKKNWGTQGELNDINNLKEMLSQMLDAKQINPNTTVAQLVGGKYNRGKFGTMSGMVANRKNQIQRRGGTAN